MLVPHLLITEPSPVKSGRKAKAITKQVCYRPPAMKSTQVFHRDFAWQPMKLSSCLPASFPVDEAWALHQNVGNIKQSRKSFHHSTTTIAYATLKLQSDVVCSSVLRYSFAESCLLCSWLIYIKIFSWNDEISEVEEVRFTVILSWIMFLHHPVHSLWQFIIRIYQPHQYTSIHINTHRHHHHHHHHHHMVIAVMGPTLDFNYMIMTFTYMSLQQSKKLQTLTIPHNLPWPFERTKSSISFQQLLGCSLWWLGADDHTCRYFQYLPIFGRGSLSNIPMYYHLFQFPELCLCGSTGLLLFPHLLDPARVGCQPHFHTMGKKLGC